MLAMASIFISAGVYAGPKEIGESKTTIKARQAIEQAAPDDWYTYAQSAEKCLRKKVNLKEAKTWLERSIEIKETPYNLAIMGDYYSKNKLPEKALEYYVKSLRVGLEQDIAYKDVITHEKMMKARSVVLKASR
jgi:tetratricopeptide (TPR) repeat protein